MHGFFPLQLMLEPQFCLYKIFNALVFLLSFALNVPSSRPMCEEPDDFQLMDITQADLADFTGQAEKPGEEFPPSPPEPLDDG